MTALRYILILVLLHCTVVFTMAQNGSKLSLSKRNIILSLDLKANKHTTDSLLKAAGITGLNNEMITKGELEPAVRQGWTIQLKRNFIVFKKVLAELHNNPPTSTYVVTTKILKTDNRPGYPGEVMYGQNSFHRISVFELPSGITRFYFPGYTNGRRVILAGSFNGWSTIKAKMNRTDTGWVYDVKLAPGKYAYKFIADGNWTIDQNNNLIENDGIGNDNSVYYRCNYTFRLKGYPAARTVNVTGSFNNWNTDEIHLLRYGDQWDVHMYLHDGIHLYRFIVDGRQIPDPANRLVHNEGGVVSSVLKLGEVVNFKLNGYTDAHQVFLAGDFTKWRADILPLQKTPSGWELPYTLAAGNYQYRFLVDGKWVTDPANPHRITVDDNTNSFISVRPNYTFRLKGYGSAHKVILAGSFNNWNTTGYTMKHEGDEWVISMNLKPGKYLYKFIVDGNWIIDPGNKLWEQNEYDTGNSFIWIETP